MSGSTDGHRLAANRILIGDARQHLRSLPAGSIDTVVTSPPYWLLRNYGMTEQIGLEPSVTDWVEQLSAVLGEVARVLKPDGSLWLNLGDTYARTSRHGARPKSLVCAPERLVLQLIEEGWILRNKLVWAKPNPTPSPVRDRLSCTWEPVYLLVRSRTAYFDLDAIRTPAQRQRRRPAHRSGQGKYRATPGTRPSWSGPLAGTNAGLAAMQARGLSAHALGKNPGDVWTLPTASYRGAHFATFPEALIERPLLASCPEQVCRTCGTPWRRAADFQRLGTLAVRGVLRKACNCTSRAWQPGVVLDPFFGAGTVGLVAERLNRRWVGIELNPDYARQAQQRLEHARSRRAARNPA